MLSFGFPKATDAEIEAAKQSWIIKVKYMFRDEACYSVNERYDPQRHSFWGAVALTPQTTADPFMGPRLQPFVYYTKLHSFLFNILVNLHGDLLGVGLSIDDGNE